MAPPGPACIMCSHLTPHSAGASSKPRALILGGSRNHSHLSTWTGRLAWACWWAGWLLGTTSNVSNGGHKAIAPSHTRPSGEESVAEFSPCSFQTQLQGKLRGICREKCEPAVGSSGKVLARKGWREGLLGNRVQLLALSEHLLYPDPE